MSNAYASLPLQRKVALTLLLTISAFAAISYVILSDVITPAFEDLELEAARSDLVRARQAIQTDIQNLQATTWDWATWDDNYYYVQGQNPAFQKSSLDRPTVDNLDLNLVAFYGRDSRLVWELLLVDGEVHDLQELGILHEDDPTFAKLTRHASPASETVGIVTTKHGPMIISSLPIVRSNELSPVAGSMIMARFLDDSRLATLREHTDVKAGWAPYSEVEQQPDFNLALFDDDNTFVDVSEQFISSQTILEDIFGAPVLVLRTETSRNISRLGGQTLKAAMMFLLLAGLILTVVMWYLLRNTILAPIELLAGHMAKIRKNGDLSRQLEISSDDEVGLLAKQFNRLTSEVHDTRKALLFQSFKAGKADTAAEVLHNIRNAMTPLLNGVERTSKTFRVADDLRVSDAVSQIRASDCAPERSEKLLEYIEASFEHIKSSNAEAQDDMRMVMSQARQVEDILADQEKFANVSPQTENIAVNEVVGEATHVIPKEVKSKVDVEVDSGLDELRVHAHRIGLLQVMSNLILNAHESIIRASRKNGHIQLSATQEIVADTPMVRLTVRDNGNGFEDDDKNRVFQRGFTSKGEGGTTGLGLHWCANAVAGMGGRISAESEGVGKGAEFHVLLPVAQGGL
jgi:two-component system NtrC family sensor kinase